MDKAPDQADSSPPAEAHTLTVEQIRRALISDNGDVRERFRREFPSEIEVLAHELHRTYGRLRQFTKSVSVDKRAAWVEMFLLAAFNSVLTSAHLLLSGFLIPAGNLMRQFGEACAIAMLASHRKIKMLERLESDSSKVWAGKSVREVEQAENQELLGIDPDGWARFAKITHWYNRYSHASALVLASLNLFDRPNTLVVGAEFDGAKNRCLPEGTPAAKQRCRVPSRWGLYTRVAIHIPAADRPTKNLLQFFLNRIGSRHFREFRRQL